MIKLYDEIKNSFEIKNTRELVSVHFSKTFLNSDELETEGRGLYQSLKNFDLIKREYEELNFYNFLKHQLLYHLQEIKYYSDVDIRNTRRLVSVSSDCISIIQILLRDKIHININFRSSDFDGALPVDLKFLSALPNVLISHLNGFIGNSTYKEVNFDLIYELQLIPVQMNLFFGSLHRTN